MNSSVRDFNFIRALFKLLIRWDYRNPLGLHATLLILLFFFLPFHLHVLFTHNHAVHKTPPSCIHPDRRASRACIRPSAAHKVAIQQQHCSRWADTLRLTLIKRPYSRHTPIRYLSRSIPSGHSTSVCRCSSSFPPSRYCTYKEQSRSKRK